MPFDGHRLHVCRIPLSIKDPNALKSIFSKFGNVLFADLRMLSGSMRFNLGKVVYEKYDEAVRAINELHNNPGYYEGEKYNLTVQFDHSYLIANQLPLPSSSVFRVNQLSQSCKQSPLLPTPVNFNNDKPTNSILSNSKKCDSDISDSDELYRYLEMSIQNDYKRRPNKVEYQKSNGNENMEKKMIQNQDTDDLNCNERNHESLNKFINGATTMKTPVLSPVKLTKINVVFSRSPHDFYIKLFEEDNINSLVASACTSTAFPKSRVNKNEIVGVQCGANGIWCRARVMNIDNDGYHLLKLIDYHMEVISTQNKIRILPNDLARKQYEVLHCSMENFASADKTWTEKDVKTFHEIVTRRDLWAAGKLVNDIYLVKLFDNKKTDVSIILAYVLDVNIVNPIRKSTINVWKSNTLIEAIVATNESPGHVWVSDNSNDVLQKLSWDLNDSCIKQQPSFDRNFQKGEIVAAREVAGERFWYRALILNVFENGCWLVQYIDFGNCELVSEVLSLPPEFEDVPAMAVSLIATKFVDRKYVRNIQANGDLELKVKSIGDGINLVETAVGDKKIVFNAVSFWDELDDVQLNNAIPATIDNKSELPKLNDSVDHPVLRYSSLSKFVDEMPKLNKSVDHSVSRNSRLAKFVDEMPAELPTAEENEDARISFLLKNCSESFEKPKLEKTIEERGSRNISTNQQQTLSSFQNKAVHCSELEQVLASENPSEANPITTSSPTVQKNNNARFSQQSREYDNLSDSFASQKSLKTSQPEAPNKQINEIPEQKDLSTEKDYLMTPICYDGEMYVQILTDETSNVFDEITKLNDVCDNLEFSLKSLPNVSDYLCGKSNVDDCWYRCKVINIVSNNSVEVRFVDYGNSEDLELDRLAKLPVESFQYPAVALSIVFDDIDPQLFSSAFEILLERHSDQFCKMRIVDNSSSPFRVIVTSFDVPLKDLLPPSENGEIFSRCSSTFSESLNNSAVDVSKTTRVLQSVDDEESSYPEYYYKEAVHNELPVGEIVEVHITQVHGPESIYCWLSDSRYKDLSNTICRLNQLKFSIAKSINSENEKYGPREYVPKEGELCLAKCPLNNDWGRASCLSSPSKEADNRLLLTCIFVDYGYIYKVDCKDIRRMQPAFMKTPIEAVFCTLDGISDNAQYTKTDYENFKKLIVAEKAYNVHVLEVKDDEERIYIIRIPSLEKELERFRK